MIHDTYKTIAAPALGEYKEKGSKFIAYAYFVQSEEEIKEKIELLKKEHFNSSLYQSKLNDTEWLAVKYIIDKLGMKTFEEYHDFYLNIDVNVQKIMAQSSLKDRLSTYQTSRSNFSSQVRLLRPLT